MTVNLNRAIISPRTLECLNGSIARKCCPLAFKLSLASDSDAYNWLVNTATIDEYNVLGSYLEKNLFSDEAKAFALEMIKAFINNPQHTYFDFVKPPFTWTYTGDDGSAFTDLNPLKEPDFKFNFADNYETLYPRFVNMVKKLKTFVKNNPKVLAALQTYSNFRKEEILDHLTFGQGPIIKIEEMYGRYGFYNKEKGINTLHISASYVRGLEQAFLESTQEATAFLLAVTLLHEYVHLATQQNKISEGVYDFGKGFERDAFNVIIDYDNAGSVVIKFSKYF
ncbi:hypothetical protein E0I26_11845 [Flavobacterium rhamnosiphilum]|uniref:Tox-MPTase3 domain-containing protein n=1 Tax=Flavobacterium rhamnosiphilum TaxID=2541724 RepID=A0A4R5F762_9FLAO|nr:hypothetical protein [Flavobacterium rhamnosiphilum]TDE43297.1 hypothetical protein E0I26_11845 [Flavobacterium rhamnosiphilum]